MERLQAFEKMLEDIVLRYEQEKKTMDTLKAQGKEKTATYRQYMGNRLFYNQLLALYREYGLISE